MINFSFISGCRKRWHKYLNIQRLVWPYAAHMLLQENQCPKVNANYTWQSKVVVRCLCRKRNVKLRVSLKRSCSNWAMCIQCLIRVAIKCCKINNNNKAVVIRIYSCMSVHIGNSFHISLYIILFDFIQFSFIWYHHFFRCMLQFRFQWFVLIKFNHIYQIFCVQHLLDIWQRNSGVMSENDYTITTLWWQQKIHFFVLICLFCVFFSLMNKKQFKCHRILDIYITNDCVNFIRCHLKIKLW